MFIKRSLVAKSRQTREEIIFNIIVSNILGIARRLKVNSNIILVIIITKRTKSYFFIRVFNTKSKSKAFKNFIN